MVIVNTFGLYIISNFKIWCMKFDLRHSLVNSLAHIMYYINCTNILFKFTLFKTHFLCLISRLNLLHKIRYATLVFFIAKNKWPSLVMTSLGTVPFIHVHVLTVRQLIGIFCCFFLNFIILDSSNEKAVFKVFKVWKLWLFCETMPLLKKTRNASCSTVRRLLWNH